MGAERRQHERFAFPHPIELKRKTDASWSAARALDISVGGLGFSTSIPLSVGDVIELGWPTLDADIIFSGVVRYVRTNGPEHIIGVEGNRAT